jgi:hypothetical protein
MTRASRAARSQAGPAERETRAGGWAESSAFRDRVGELLPTVFITLVSVLIGLVLSDLVSEARTRMRLWPLSLSTLRTWSQLVANGAGALSAWIVYVHVSIGRRRVPTLWDSLIAFLVPISLLVATSFVGANASWPWFYAMSIFLAISVATSAGHLRLALSEPELSPLRSMLRPTGHLGVLAGSAVLYAAIGLADQRGWVTVTGEVILAAGATPMALLISYIFFREWHEAIGQAAPGAERREPASLGFRRKSKT